MNNDLEKRRVLEHPVVAYVTPRCELCERALALFASYCVTPVVVDVSKRPEIRIWLRDVTGQRTIPQIFIRGKSMGGYSELMGLDVVGRLESRLAGIGGHVLPRVATR